MRSRHRGGSARRAAAVAALVALGALAAGCGGGPSAMSEAGGDAADSAGASESRVDQRAVKAAPFDRPGGPEAEGTSAVTGGANRPTVQTRAVIRKGEISVVTEEMNRARTEIDDLLGRVGGYIASEDTVNDRAGRPEHSVLVLRVPEPAFDDSMARLDAIGRTEHADRTSEDVTSEIIDVDTRVATQEASIARLQKLLDQATDVEDMVRIESEIANRQVELESMKAQQKYLRDETAMSTITVRLGTPGTPPPDPDDSGFLAGLRNGWRALTAMLLGAATIVGAVLPFALTLALLGVPAWLLLRAASRRRQVPAPPTAASESS